MRFRTRKMPQSNATAAVDDDGDRARDTVYSLQLLIIEVQFNLMN